MKTITLKCNVCGKNFYVYHRDHRIIEGSKIKYCSRKCMGIGSETKTKRKCECCNKEFESARKYPKGRFCSKECFYKYKTKNYNHKTYEENGYNVLFINGYNKKGNVKEHRFIVEQHLGRKLKQNEIVHHINGNKKDNRIGNLQVMTRSEHSKLHREMELADGKNLFGR